VKVVVKRLATTAYVAVEAVSRTLRLHDPIRNEVSELRDRLRQRSPTVLCPPLSVSRRPVARNHVGARGLVRVPV